MLGGNVSVPIHDDVDPMAEAHGANHLVVAAPWRCDAFCRCRTLPC
jgi:hypothetical protein